MQKRNEKKKKSTLHKTSKANTLGKIFR